MKVEVLAFGKLRGPGLREAADHYLKLASKFVTLTERELKPIPVPDKSEATRLQIQQKEMQLLDSAIGPRTTLFLLDEEGKSMRSTDWAMLLSGLAAGSVPHVIFALGSSLGFAPELKKRARGTLSLGPQTLPHELARVVLLEQIFRAASINAGHPYHVDQ
jgi:23S rRNA (pseudouridine1915-N3)-methyltransferase